MADEYLQGIFSSLTDKEIVARINSGLTAEAHEIACRELKSRGAEPPAAPEPAADPVYPGDMVILARDLEPMEANILASLLAASGILADPGDVNTVIGNWLWSIAMGGVKIRVPQSQLAEARQILDDFRRGAFTLGDDFDAGSKIE